MISEMRSSEHVAPSVRVCDLNIDSGSIKNITLKSLVSKLGLKTEKHLSLYKISWIKKGM